MAWHDRIINQLTGHPSFTMTFPRDDGDAPDFSAVIAFEGLHLRVEANQDRVSATVTARSPRSEKAEQLAEVISELVTVVMVQVMAGRVQE